MKNKIILALLLVCALSAPVFAKAVTMDELRAQIASLQAQIAQLLAQLAQQQGNGSTAWCHTFDTNLGMGSGGSEVEALQTALAKDGAKSWEYKGYDGDFDEMTASAVVGFQEKYASEILTPLGLKHGTGYVGKSTRAKLNKLYGCGQSTNLPQMMDLSLYVQDKSYVATSSCSVTKKVMYKVPKTVAVADASLKILFGDELSTYGVYKSVSIVNGVAKVLLESSMTPKGYPISALSSCESSHMSAVLKDTLTQYSSIKSVQLLSPEGIIQF